MGVYIKGMEMPTSCEACRFHDGWCLLLPGIAQERNERREDCPLVHVPPHGRLIDADALLQNKEVNTYEAAFAVAKAPTIIPEEPEAHVCDNCKWFGGLMCDHVDENYKCLGWEAEEGEI